MLFESRKLPVELPPSQLDKRCSMGPQRHYAGSEDTQGSHSTCPFYQRDCRRMPSFLKMRRFMSPVATVSSWGSDFQRDAPTDVVAIACGGVHSVALRNDGTVVTWGNILEGQRNGAPTFVVASSRLHAVNITVWDCAAMGPW